MRRSSWLRWHRKEFALQRSLIRVRAASAVFSYHAAIAPRQRIICGLVLEPLRTPLNIAEQLAALELLSSRKLVFGAGIGYRDVEFKTFGVPRDRLGARLEERLIAIRRRRTEDFVTVKRAVF